jgi:putative transposase
MKGESYNTSQIRRLKRKIRSLNNKKNNIRMNFIRELVNYITARTKPNTITIENLDISEMIKHNGTKDTTLHKYISESGFYYFKTLLESKCEYYGIKLRYANKYFASSKTCSHCGKNKNNLTLNDRVFICDYCGFKINRDENAAFNLLNLKDKKCDIKFA